MLDAILKTLSFAAIILLGFGLKQAKVFGPMDYSVMVKVVTHITLPVSIVVSFSNSEFDWSLLSLTLLGLAINGILVVLGLLVSRGKPAGSRALTALVLQGFNIGAFAMPFTAGAFGTAGATATCLFDAGNAILCTGGSYAIVDGVLTGTKGFQPKALLKKLCSTPPFVAYVVMLLVTMAGLRLPRGVVDFVTPIANANPYCAMMMMGLMFRLDFPKETFRQVGALVAARFGIGILLALGCYFLLPLPLTARQVLAVLVFAPPSVLTPVFVENCGGDASAASCAASLCTLTAVIGITAVLMLL